MENLRKRDTSRGSANDRRRYGIKYYKTKDNRRAVLINTTETKVSCPIDKFRYKNYDNHGGKRFSKKIGEIYHSCL